MAAATTSEIAKRRLESLKRRRKLWLSVHLYLGLGAGAVLLVIALTGSVLTFWQEIDRWLNPELSLVNPADTKQELKPMHEIIAAATAAMPANATLSFAYPPHFPEMAYFFFYDVPASTPDSHHTLNVFVNPYTAQVLGTRTYYSADSPLGHCFIGFIFKLHYALLTGPTGAVVVGLLGVAFIISVLTGLILWWPLTGRWRQALTIKRNASGERLNYDLHKTFGFYACVTLLAVLLSGVSMNLPEQFTWLVQQMSPVAQTQHFTTRVDPGKRAISVDEAWAIAKPLYPEGYLYWFSVPVSDSGVFVFTQNGPLGAGFHGRRKIIVDRYGSVLYRFDSLQGSGGSVFMQWMWPLHSGQFYGMAGRLAVCLSGLACVLLFVTGFLRWRHKRRAANQRFLQRPIFQR